MLDPLRRVALSSLLVIVVSPYLTSDLAAQQWVTQIQRHGITWSFTEPVLSGHYVNGDPWVVAPATVASVSPTPSSGRHGSMVNPRAGNAGRNHGQGYDNRIAFYDPARSVQFPYALQVDDSMVSTESRTGPQQPGPYRGVNSQAYLARAAVLTCVDAPPIGDTFRPAYCGPKIHRRIADLHLDRLPTLPRVANSLTPATFERQFERVWLDHVDGWEGRYQHPYENMPDYGREIALAIGEGGLLLLQDFPADERASMLVHYLQVGIDLYGCVLDGHVWWADGGHMQGRKWPIMFAGILFDDPSMANPGAGFSEDKQTYAGTAWTNSRALFRMRSTDTHEQTHPSTWNSQDINYEDYRRCCTSFSWIGSALCAHIMGATENWNWEPFFHYVDRWMTPMHSNDQSLVANVVGNTVIWFPHTDTRSSLVTEMWDAYRNDYQPEGVSLVGHASEPTQRCGVFTKITRGQPLDIHVWNPPQSLGVMFVGPILPNPVQVLGGTLYINPVAQAALPAPQHCKSLMRLNIPGTPATGTTVGIQFAWLDAAAGVLQHSWAYALEL